MTTTTANTVGGLMSALTTPAGQADPYPLYRELRELGPADHTPDRTLVVSGYRLASTLLRDHRFLKRPEHGLAVSGFPDWRDHPGLRLMSFPALLRAFPELTQAGPAVARKGLALHGLTALPVLAGARAA